MTIAGPVRRVVTGHDDAGRAVIWSDRYFTPAIVPSGDAAFALLWTTADVPANNDDDGEGRDRPAGLTLDRGSVIRVVDMLPGGMSPMHRSNSIDYGIVLSGTVDLVLDDGAVSTLKPGEIVVQRGTIHAWRNPSTDTPAPIVFVLIEAAARTVDGRPLPEIHP